MNQQISRCKQIDFIPHQTLKAIDPTRPRVSRAWLMKDPGLDIVRIHDQGWTISAVLLQLRAEIGGETSVEAMIAMDDPYPLTRKVAPQSFWHPCGGKMLCQNLQL
jgi:hypothetical protein